MFDHATDKLISDTIDPDSRWYYYRLPRQEFYDYLAGHAQKVTDFENPSYGEIHVYRFTWK